MQGSLSREDIEYISQAKHHPALHTAYNEQIEQVAQWADLGSTATVQQRNHTVDTLRDVAVCLESEDIFLAGNLMRMALRLRPDGPFLRKKIQEYEGYLAVAEHGQCTIDDVVLSFPPHPPVGLLRAFVNGSYEKKEAELVAKVIGRSDRVLELGAGVGFMGITVMQRCQPAYYVAYEANPALIDYIQKNQQLNGVSFDIHNAVLLEKEDQCSFYVTPAFWGSSLLQPQQGEWQLVTVPSLNKHKVMADALPTVLIVDIEGGEAAFFEGLDLSSVQKVIVEIHPQVLTDKELISLYTTLIHSGFLLDFKASGRQELYWYRPHTQEVA